MPSCLTGELGFVDSTLVVATGAGVLTVIAWGDLKPTDAYPAAATARARRLRWGAGTPGPWCEDEPTSASQPPWSGERGVASSRHERAQGPRAGVGLVRTHPRVVPGHGRVHRPRMDRADTPERVRVQGLRDRLRARRGRARCRPRRPPALEPDRMDLLRPRPAGGHRRRDHRVRPLGAAPRGGSAARR